MKIFSLLLIIRIEKGLNSDTIKLLTAMEHIVLINPRRQGIALAY